jgi:hypothetical protein
MEMFLAVDLIPFQLATAPALTPFHPTAATAPISEANIPPATSAEPIKTPSLVPELIASAED